MMFNIIKKTAAYMHETSYRFNDSDGGCSQHFLSIVLDKKNIHLCVNYNHSSLDDTLHQFNISIVMKVE